MEELTIRRDFYVEKLLGRRMNGFVKVITGIRRCGKSTIGARQLGPAGIVIFFH